MNETGFNKQFLLLFYYNKSNILKLELKPDFSTSFYKVQMQVFLSALSSKRFTLAEVLRF